MFRKGHVQIQGGPLEVIIGEGLGPNRPVADFFRNVGGALLPKIFRRGHVQIQSGPLEIIIGEGLGHNMPVADFSEMFGVHFCQPGSRTCP